LHFMNKVMYLDVKILLESGASNEQELL